MATKVKSFRLSDEDAAKLETVLTRANISLADWVKFQITQMPAGAPAHVSAQARTGDDEGRALRAETARLREETKAAVVLSPDAMAILEPLFRQCAGKWPEYRGPGGFAEWLGDAAFGFVALNARALGLDLGRHADGALSATPMLRALVCRVVQGLVLPKRRCWADGDT